MQDKREVGKSQGVRKSESQERYFLLERILCETLCLTLCTQFFNHGVTQSEAQSFTEILITSGPPITDKLSDCRTIGLTRLIPPHNSDPYEKFLR